jgi:hypothetical protein
MSLTLSSTQGAGVSSLTCVLHGPAGAGKTYSVRTCPGKALILSNEAGLLSLRDQQIDVIEVGNRSDLREAYAFLKGGNHDYEWIFFDSLTEMGEAVLTEQKAIHNDGRAAYGETKDILINLVRLFRNLPLHVVFICSQGRSADEEGIVDRRPLLPGPKLSNRLPYLVDLTLALETAVDADGNTTRFFVSESINGLQAKDRSGALDRFEPVDWALIHSKIAGAINAKD